MTDLATPLPSAADLPPREPWSGVGAVGWDGVVAPTDQRLLSASSVPKALKSEALERWAVTETGRRLLDQLPKLNALANQDPDAALAWIENLRWEPKPGDELNAADTGTDMHTLLESWLRGTAVPADVEGRVQRDPAMWAMAENLWRWYCRFEPEPVLMEHAVYDPAHGIAGRLDLVCRFRKAPQLGLCLVDLKNSRDAKTRGGNRKKPYADTQALQLASYRWATHVATFEPRVLITEKKSSARVYLLNEAEKAACDPMPELDGSYILQNNPESCLLYPVSSTRAVHYRAVQAEGLWRWLNEESRLAVGEPFLPSIEMPNL